MHILNKNLIQEQEQKEEIIEELESQRTRADNQKAKKMNGKKEIQGITKQHKIEVSKLQTEIDTIKKSWIDPKQVQKMKSKEKDLESQIKSLKEDLARKRDFIASLKQSQETTQKEVIQKVVKNETRKEDHEKISKLSKELSRKEAMLKEVKSQYEEHKEKTTSFQSEIKSFQTKMKSLKSDVSRKENILKETKEKYEAELEEIRSKTTKSVDLSKHKEMIKKYKQDLERREIKISGLESKLETSASELEKIRSESLNENKIAKSEAAKEIKRLENSHRKIRKMEEVTETGIIVLRRIINEMFMTVEKLQSELVICQKSMSHNYSEGAQSNLMNYQEKPNTPGAAKDVIQEDASKICEELLGISLEDLNGDKLLHSNDSFKQSTEHPSKPGLELDDLKASQKDICLVFDSPERLLTQSEAIIATFKSLLAEIQSLSAQLSQNQ